MTADFSEPAAPHVARSEILDRMATALHSSRLLIRTADRMTLIAAVAARTREPLIVEASDHEMTHLTFLVRDCAAASCLDALVAEMARLLDRPALEHLRQLQDEWAGLDHYFSDDDWQLLSHHLSRLDLTNALDLCRRTLRFGFDFGSPPPHCQTVWHLFAHLTTVNSAGRRVPPFMLFVWLVADQLPGDKARPLQSLLDRLAQRWEITDDFQRARYELASTPVDDRGNATLLILIEPLALSEGYSVQHWFQRDRSERPVPGDDQRVTRDGLEAAVQQIVADAEADHVTGPGKLRIEFLLPLNLLNLPVERWSKWNDPLDGPVPLYQYHPVVVRSLDRIRDRQRHRTWRTRWQNLLDAPLIADWVASRGRDHPLEPEINRGERIVTLVLSEPPPGENAAREIRIALRTGIPIIIWHRSRPLEPPFLQLVKDLVAGGGVAELPDRASTLRINASMNQDEWGLGLVLLWDDPYHLPRQFGPALGEG